MWGRWGGAASDGPGVVGWGRAVYAWPVAVGNGWVEAAHGRLPVPAPATAILLEGVDLATGGPVEGEATTPTGAALVRVLAAGPPPGQWRMVTSGWGAGQRNPKHYPNALRVLVAEQAAEAGRVALLATDVEIGRASCRERV